MTDRCHRCGRPSLHDDERYEEACKSMIDWRARALAAEAEVEGADLSEWVRDRMEEGLR
jgi:hypothetical protein